MRHKQVRAKHLSVCHVILPLPFVAVATARTGGTAGLGLSTKQRTKSFIARGLLRGVASIHRNPEPEGDGRGWVRGKHVSAYHPHTQTYLSCLVPLRVLGDVVAARTRI